MSTLFRFELQPYIGPKSRHTCPACGHRRELTRFVDTVTGDLLPDEYGKCNRADQCGYFLSPYHAPPGGLSYAEQVRAAELPAATLAPRPTAAPVVSIPQEVMTATLGYYRRNTLAQLLQAHFGAGVAAELLTRFHLGTSAHWPGACVFWLIDEQGLVRGGQVVLYDQTGHTVKQPQRCTTWAHTALATRASRLGQPVPDWLTAYSAHEVPKCPCLFGLPQLVTAPPDLPVAIVESAKTAMLCTPYLPGYIWLATMGKSYLTAERLAPVKHRALVLFPDAGATADWQRRADELTAQGFTVRVSDWLETQATAEQRRQGIDLADLLLEQWPGYPPSWDQHGEDDHPPPLPEGYQMAVLLGSLQADTLYFPEQAARRIRLAAPDVPDAYQLLQEALAAGWLTAEPTGEFGYCSRCWLPSTPPEQHPATALSVAHTARFRPAPGSDTRRPYTRADYNYLRQHYANSTLAACALHLGRTVGSLKQFLRQHPELRKHGTP